MSTQTLIRLELLGVPVVLHCDDGDAAARLELCYARSAVEQSPSREAAIQGELRRAAGGWSVKVEGRKLEACGGMIDGVRALHHELLHAVMRRRPQVFFVHAGVVEYEGRAVVLPGISRAGKSTLVLAFLHRGARLLSDELLAFDPEAGRCCPFPRAVKIRDVCVPSFPRWTERFVGHGEGRFLPFDALPHDVVAGPTPVGAVVSPRWHEADATTLQPMGRGAAVLELAKSALNFGTHRAASVDHLSEVVRDATAFRLRWHEPHEAVRQVCAALDSRS